MTPLVVRRLTLALAALYAVLGTLELVLKLAEGTEVGTVAFFGGTLLGGAALLLGGLFTPLSGTARRALVILGAMTGLLASVWTLLLPILAITVIVGQVRLGLLDEAVPPER